MYIYIRSLQNVIAEAWWIFRSVQPGLTAPIHDNAPIPTSHPFTSCTHSHITPIHKLHPFPHHTHSQVAPIPTSHPFTSCTHSHITPIHKLHPFPHRAHSHIAPIPTSRPFPHRTHSQLHPFTPRTLLLPFNPYELHTELPFR